TLGHGRLRGFVTGLGAATADTLYGLVAAAGITALTQALVAWGPWLHRGGAVFLAALGLKIALGRPAEKPAAETASALGLLRAYVLTFLLTVANPLPILSF